METSWKESSSGRRPPGKIGLTVNNEENELSNPAPLSSSCADRENTSLLTLEARHMSPGSVSLALRALSLRIFTFSALQLELLALPSFDYSSLASLLSFIFVATDGKLVPVVG